MNEHGPLLICARSFPPRLGGSAILSRNLWGAWPANDLVVLSEGGAGLPIDPNTALPGVRVEYVTPWLESNPSLRAFCEPLRMFAVRRALVRLAREIRPRALWVNWPSTGFLLGAWLAAREVGLPLYVHMHDTWEESLTGLPVTLNRLAPRVFERRVLKSAANVFAITEEAAAHFRAKHGCSTSVLKHCIPDADIEAAVRVGASEIENRIHFAGGIYPLMNQDAVVNLVKALDHCTSGITLDGYTFDVTGLAAAGIGGPRVSLRYAPKAEVMAAQRRSALLFLPLAFHSTNPTEIQTVFPTKLLEYLVSGRPILVHAPPDSWVSRAARTEGWGEVVDEPDSRQLAHRIDSLLADQPKQEALVTAAFKAACDRRASAVAHRLNAELGTLEREDVAKKQRRCNHGTHGNRSDDV
jgi:glycosyltransferase involved in cell wall biosynthesis